MKGLATLGVFVAVVCSLSPTAFAAAPPDGGQSGDTIPPGPTETVPGTLAELVPETAPVILGQELGAPTPAPVQAASAPLIQTPAGCSSPPPASVVFVGTLVAKDLNTARYRVDQIRAGNADPYIVTGLVDVRYQDETQYLTLNDQYLIGAARSGTSVALSSKVRATDPLFGGNAVIGLTEENRECPAIDDPIRTLHVDGTEVENSVFTGLADSKDEIALAFVKPLAVAFVIILALVLIRWLFTAIFVSVRNAADGEPVTPLGSDRRHHLPDV